MNQTTVSKSEKYRQQPNMSPKRFATHIFCNQSIHTLNYVTNIHQTNAIAASYVRRTDVMRTTLERRNCARLRMLAAWELQICVQLGIPEFRIRYISVILPVALPKSAYVMTNRSARVALWQQAYAHVTENSTRYN